MKNMAHDKHERLEWLREHPEATGGLSAEEARTLLEDLSLHHAELEMQNEELKRAQEEIEESRERLSDLYDYAPVAYLTLDGKGVIREANLTAANLLGVARQQLIGKTLLYFVDAGCRDEYFRHHRAVIRGRQKATCEVQLKRKGGPLFYGRLESIPVDGLLQDGSMRTVIADVTERVQAEAALREAKEQYFDTLESITDGFVTLDFEWRLTYVNSEAERLFGLNREALVGKVLWKDVAPHLVNSVTYRKFRKTMMERVPVAFETSLPDGSSWLEARAYPNKHGLSIYFHDVSERKRLEEQLRQSQKLEAIGTLAGGVAHDFNNMLAVIMGNAELILDGLKDNGLGQNVQQIIQASKRARDMVKQILTFSRKDKQVKEPLALADLVRETYTLLRGAVPATIRMELDVRAESDTVLANQSQMQQVLMNLATNAADAMREKGGVLTIRLSNATVTRQKRAADLSPGSYVALSVEDTGTGMTERTRRRIFEPFFTTKEAGRGTGMGLAVVYGIVKAHGGAITVESKPGEGSTFTVFLPSTGAQTVDERSEAGDIPGGKERILLVDDEPAIIETTEQTLRQLGYRVTTAQGGPRALEIFLKDPHGFDLLITDQTMPDLTGVDLAKKVSEVRKDVPVILFTGYSDAVSPETAHDAGISEFVMKPAAKREVAQTIRRVLDAEAKR